uniref:RNase H type-1 domain-containing protein n=1 Tax=Trichogramma kaykai TaxID=54128 RepID=A0ABD2W2X7_9HYME
MDDFLDSCESSEEALAVTNQVILINRQAGFEMYNWSSNCSVIHAELTGKTHSEVSPYVVNASQQNVEKVLGLRWLNESDCLLFNVDLSKVSKDVLSGSSVASKRQCLGLMMSIFDPLGYLIPYTIQARFIFQGICKNGTNWDEPMQKGDFWLWKNWLNKLLDVALVRINRCYQSQHFQSRKAELHVFCDASSRAYGAVAYWRFRLPNGSFHVAFIMAKSKVVSLKSKTTIPRLELQAALIAVRLAEFIREEHDFEVTQRFFWSDSRVVLQWIAKEPNAFKSFVSNRLHEI